MTPKEHKAEYNRKYYANNREKIAEAKRRYYADNCGKIAEARRKHYVKNHGKLLEAHREYVGTIIGSLRHRFSDMKRRCGNPNATDYERYGGRGIRCNFKSSDEFVDYVVNTLKVDPRGLQIDRINNDGNYEAGNIRFVTAKVNNNNKRKMRRGKSK